MKPIWIVDDDQSIRFVLEKALMREDLPTRSFTNAREVLAAMESGTDEDGPQILVSDIRMPGGSGLDLLTKVKEKHPGLPVIIMTAFSDLDSAVSAFQRRQHLARIGEAARRQVLAHQRFLEHEADGLVIVNDPDRLHVFPVTSVRYSSCVRARG